MIITEENYYPEQILNNDSVYFVTIFNFDLNIATITVKIHND